MLITQPNTQLTTHHTSPFQLDSRTNFSIQRGILLHSKKTQYIHLNCVYFLHYVFTNPEPHHTFADKCELLSLLYMYAEIFISRYVQTANDVGFLAERDIF